MDGILLQDWLTIRAAGSNVIVAQSVAGWLDTRHFIDVVFWTEVANVTAGGGTVRLDYQTAPCSESSAFVSVLPGAISLSSPGLVVPVTKALFNTATTPLQKLLRWQLSNPTATAAWDATLRIWLAVSRSSPTFYPSLREIPQALATREARGERQLNTSPPSPRNEPSADSISGSWKDG